MWEEETSNKGIPVKIPMAVSRRGLKMEGGEDVETIAATYSVDRSLSRPHVRVVLHPDLRYCRRANISRVMDNELRDIKRCAKTRPYLRKALRLGGL